MECIDCMLSIVISNGGDLVYRPLQAGVCVWLGTCGSAVCTLCGSAVCAYVW